jgi:hypothetical protein
VRLRGRELPIDVPPPDVASLVAAHLRGKGTILPPASGDENPADIFVDLATLSGAWRSVLQSEAASVLRAWVADLGGNDPAFVAAVGELCYLVARIGSPAALEPLQRLVENPRATGLVAPGEDLRLRSLRALVGLLGAGAAGNPGDYRPLLEQTLTEPGLAVTAAVGLIALWPGERAAFLRRLPSSLDVELVDVGLAVLKKER